MTRTSQSTPSLKSRVQSLEDERQQTQRALDALYRIGLACRGQHDPYNLLITIFKELQTVWNFDACFIALCDQADLTRYRLALLVDEGQIEWNEHDKVGTITGYMIQHRTPLLFNDLTIERASIGLPTVSPFGSSKLSRAWMGVPLLVGQGALGVISLQSYTVGLFKASDLDLLRRIANSMAVALENAILAHRQAELTRSLAQQVELRNANLYIISDIAALLTQQQAPAETFGMALDFILDTMNLDAGVVWSVEDGAVETLASRGVADLPRLVPARADDPETPDIAALDQLGGLAATILLPLQRDETTIGSLLIGNEDPREFKDEERDLLRVVGNQLALALEHGRILSQQQRQIAELEALSQISYATSRALNASTLLRQMNTALRSFLDHDVFYMAIYDPERAVLTDSIAIESGKEARYITEESAPRPGSFTEWVVSHRQTLFLRNVTADLPRYPEIVRRTIGGPPAETWIGVPMLDSGEQPLGVISIQSYRPNAFTERDVRFLQAVASQVSLHVLNVGLFAQRERQLAELNALQRISELVSSTLDVGPMIHSIDSVLTDFLGIDEFFVVLHNRETGTIEALHVLEGGEIKDFPSLIGTPVPPGTPTAWVIEHRQSLRFNDLTAELANHPSLRPVQISADVARSWLGVPLMIKAGETLGVLTVQSYRPNRFSARDEQFMLQVARQLSLAIQNARLFAQRERQLAELDSQQQITKLVSSTLDLHQMLRSIDEVLRSFLSADGFQAVIVDYDRGLVETVVVLEEGQDVQSRLVGQPLPPGTFVGWTLQNARPLRMADLYTEWQDYPGIADPMGNSEQRFKHSWLSVPLLEPTGRPLGVIAVRAYREGAFGPGDEIFLLNVGRQLALSVRNARLYAAEQTAHRTAETLREIARVLNTTFNPDEVLTLILRELKKVVNFDSASVMLPAGKMLRIVARQADEDADDLRWRDLTFPLDESSAAGRVMLQREPLVISDTLADSEWTPSPMSNVVRSWIGVPLINKGNVVGVLNINALKPHRFSINDAEIALAFANQAATALEHARLYQESVTRVEQELEIARRIQSNLFPRTLPSAPGVSLAALCFPARETGGDFYDVIELRPGQLAMLVGDASGKSIPGAMLMAVARSIARSEARDHREPEMVMSETNRWVTLDVPPHTFVALVYATYDTVTRSLALANAGQLDPLVLRASGELEYLTAPGPHFPLGIIADIPYETATYDLHPGDTVLLYTDGVVEAKAADGEMWSFERLEQVMRDWGHELEPAALIEAIVSAINEFIGDFPQHDDMTLVALRVEEGA